MAFFSASIKRCLCALRGHGALLDFQPNKLSLKCHLCGYESPGWNLALPRAPLALTNSSSKISAFGQSGRGK